MPFTNYLRISYKNEVFSAARKSTNLVKASVLMKGARRRVTFGEEDKEELLEATRPLVLDDL